MRQGFTIAIALAALFAVGQMLAQTSRTAEVQFKAAQHKEQVEGDLKGAIEQYKKLADGKDRAIAAQALIRMAECYQKLGDPESKKIYERLVRDYADQKEAVAIARARLGANDGAARSEGERSVWTDPKGALGKVSADGRFLTYVDAANNNVVLRDLAAGIDRVLSKGTRSEGVPGVSAISRDGKQVAFERYMNSRREVELRIANVQSSDASEGRFVLALSLDNAGSLSPTDWSPDGRWLAVKVLGPPTTRLGLVSVQAGTLHVLKSTGWQGTGNIFFSPDGRYIAYSDGSKVFVMAIDGSRESVVNEHPSRNVIMGWSPDGAHLLFASDRSGSFGLWTVSVTGGQSHATPTLIKSGDIGDDPRSLGLTASGALYVTKSTRDRYIQVAPIDLNTGTLLEAPGGSFRTFVGGGGKPAWSPDGKYLAYRSCRGNCGITGAVAIRSMDTDQVRELPMRLRYLQGQEDLEWSSDGRSLIVWGTDLKGHLGIYRIDAQTGETSPDSSGVGPGQRANVTMDGKNLYVAVGGRIVERELSSGKERVTFQERAPGNIVPPRSLQGSPDGRYISFIENDPSTKMSTLVVMPFGGGEPRELLRAPAPTGSWQRMIWTPDSRALIVPKNGKELWLVPVVDGAPRKLDIDIDNWLMTNQTGGFRLRPNGRQIAFVVGEDKFGVWALENFLPKAAK